MYDRTPIVSVPRLAHSFEVMKCDILGRFPDKSSRDHEYILGVIDVSTRWLELIPIKRVTSPEVLVLIPYMYVARVNQVEVVVDKERQLEILRVCPLSDDIVHVPEAVGRFEKLDLTRLSPVGRSRLTASLNEFVNNLYGKPATQVVAFVVRKDRVGIG